MSEAMLRDPQLYAQQVSEMAHRLFTVLHVPSPAQVWQAGGTASHDGYQAIVSISQFIVLICRPFVLALGWFVVTLARLIWEHVIVNGLYNHGLSQTKEALFTLWKFQKGLTPKQLLLEAVVCAALVAIYLLRQWLQRNRYIQRAQVWINRKSRQTQEIYRSALGRIASVSLALAAMIPHGAFVACTATLSILLPTVVAMVATPGVLSLISWWYPLFCTVTLLHEAVEQTRGTVEETPISDKENDPPSSARKEPSTARSKSSRKPLSEKKKKEKTPSKLKRKKRRSSVASISVVSSSTEKNMEDELQYWLRFWMVRSAVEVVKLLLRSFTPSWIAIIFQNLSFFFYIWIYLLPFLVPQTIGGQQLPEARPLQVLVSYLSPAVHNVHDKVTSVVSAEFWQNHVVGYASKLMDLAVLMRLLSRPSADWGLHVVEEMRPLILPGVTLFMPGFITQYGVLYVQYVLSVAKSSESPTSERWLKYWVLNAIVTSALHNFSGILWWIPFSSHATFLLWAYLSLPNSIDKWYGYLHQDLGHYGMLPGSEMTDDWSKTLVGRLLTGILMVVPKAQDAGNNGDDGSGQPATDTNNNSGDANIGMPADEADILTLNATFTPSPPAQQRESPALRRSPRSHQRS